MGRPRKEGERFPSGDLRLGRDSGHPATTMRRAIQAAGQSLYGDDNTCVYVLEAEGTHTVKVGTSKDPYFRWKTMQTGSHNNLVLYWVGRVPPEMGRKVEQAAHEILKAQKRHQRGEWFNCSAAYARGVVLTAGNNLGVSVKDDMSYHMIFRDRA